MQKQYTRFTGFKQGQSSRSVEIKKGFSEFAGFKQKQSSRSIGLKKNQFPKSTGQRKKVTQVYRPKIQLKQVTGPDLNKPPIKLQAVGNEWLKRSAIAKLKPMKLIHFLQDQLRNLGYMDILVRPTRGDSLVLTFPSSESMDSALNSSEMAWLKDWFLELQKME